MRMIVTTSELFMCSKKVIVFQFVLDACIQALMLIMTRLCSNFSPVSRSDEPPDHLTHMLKNQEHHSLAVGCAWPAHINSLP